jgi:hypothetical protein
MSNIKKQKLRRKAYEKAMRYKKSSLPKVMKGMRITAKMALSIHNKSR